MRKIIENENKTEDIPAESYEWDTPDWITYRKKITEKQN